MEETNQDSEQRTNNVSEWVRTAGNSGHPVSETTCEHPNRLKAVEAQKAAAKIALEVAAFRTAQRYSRCVVVCCELDQVEDFFVSSLLVLLNSRLKMLDYGETSLVRLW